MGKRQTTFDRAIDFIAITDGDSVDVGEVARLHSVEAVAYAFVHKLVPALMTPRPTRMANAIWIVAMAVVQRRTARYYTLDDIRRRVEEHLASANR